MTSPRGRRTSRGSTAAVDPKGRGSGKVAFQEAQARYNNRPTIPRFHEAAVVIEDTGCGLLRGLRQISESTDCFAFLSSFRPL